MKQEYKEKLEKAKNLLDWNTQLPVSVLDSNVDKGCDLLEELVLINDVEVLAGLLEFFTDANEDYGGVCETLMNDIESNYTVDQIIEAVALKFNYLIENDLDRFANLSQSFFCYDMPKAFVNFRLMFNDVKPKRANDYINAINEWVGKDFPHEISLLREDMEQWEI